MSIIARLETLYLAMLRVIVLAVATLALIVAVIAVALSAPAIWQRLGLVGHDQVSGESLGNFIAEERAEGVTVAEPQQARAPQYDTAIGKSADLIARYAKDRLGLTLDTKAIASSLVARQYNLPEQYRRQYSSDLQKILNQLSRSSGKPLTTSRIDELVTWHFDRFKAGADQAQADAIARDAGAVKAMMVGGASLVVFLLIIFLFLFIRIERNLRPIQTRDEALPAFRGAK